MKIYMIILFIFLEIVYADGVSVLGSAENATFRIINIAASGTGSGFVVNKEGYLITNNHVVENYQDGKLLAINRFRKYKDVKVIETYPKKDIAILKIEGYQGNAHLKLCNPNRIQSGMKCFSLGYPGGSDLIGDHEALSTPTIKEGIVSKLVKTSESDTKFYPGFNMIEMSASVNGGNSGGPLLNDEGEVIGINTMKNNDVRTFLKHGEIEQGIFWAISVKELIKVLKQKHIIYNHESKKKYIYFIFALALLSLFYFVKKNREVHIDEHNKGEDKEDIVDINKQHNQSIDKNSRVVIPKRNSSEHFNTVSMLKLVPLCANCPTIHTEKESLLTLGRSQENDIVIHDDYISRKHLKIYFKDNSIFIEDVGSSNGTYIEGRRVEPYQKIKLQIGQKLSLGSDQIIYRVQG